MIKQLATLKENLPRVMLDSKRFLKVSNKVPIDANGNELKGWTSADNQFTADKVSGLVGFYLGNGEDTDPLFAALDFDHVLDDNGNFVNDNAAKCYESIIKKCDSVYCEKSVSGNGLHMFLIPTEGKFESVGKKVINFSDITKLDKEEKKTAPKLEIFYKTPRQIVLTGDTFVKGDNVPSGDTADTVLKKLLDIVKSQEPKKEIKSAEKVTRSPRRNDSAEPYINDMAVALFEFGNLADSADREKWLAAISALKSLGFSKEEVRTLCQTSDRYDKSNFDSEFDSVSKNGEYGINTLKGLVKDFNCNGFINNWYDQHPEFKTLNGLPLPSGYHESNGKIYKDGETPKLISYAPVYIAEKIERIADHTFKLRLGYEINHKKKFMKPRAARDIFDKSKLIECTNECLLFTSSNAKDMVDYLHKYYFTNADALPLRKNFDNCGWNQYDENGKTYFIDPRINNTIEEDGHQVNLSVDADTCKLVNCLISKGDLNKWIDCYKTIKSSLVARFTTAAAAASILLEPLNLRNFVYYLYGTTHGGKSSLQLFASSIFGNDKQINTLNGSPTGLISKVAENDTYPVFFDEGETQDPKQQDNRKAFIYAHAEGVEKPRADIKGTFREPRRWKNILLANGESQFVDDNITGGAFNRILQVPAPDTIFSPEQWRVIRQTIAENYGVAFVPYLNYILQNLDRIKASYNARLTAFRQNKDYDNILDEYKSFIAVISVADEIFNRSLELTEEGFNHSEIFAMLQTKEEVDDDTRVKNDLIDFIATNPAHFDGTDAFNKSYEIYGEITQYKDYHYFTNAGLNEFCKRYGYKKKFAVAHLLKAKIFIPAEKNESGHKKPLPTVQAWIQGKNTRCYQIPRETITNNNSKNTNVSESASEENAVESEEKAPTNTTNTTNTTNYIKYSLNTSASYLAKNNTEKDFLENKKCVKKCVRSVKSVRTA